MSNVSGKRKRDAQGGGRMVAAPPVISDAAREKAMAYKPPDPHTAPPCCTVKFAKVLKHAGTCKPWLLYALLDVANTPWCHGWTPQCISILLDEKNRNLIRAEIVCHPVVARQIATALDGQNHPNWTRVGPAADDDTVRDAVLHFCVGAQKGVVKLVANRFQAGDGRRVWTEKIEACKAIDAGYRQQAAAVDVLQVHQRASAVAAAVGGAPPATVAVCGIGRAALTVVRTCALAQAMASGGTFVAAAPDATVWAACDADARLAVACSADGTRLVVTLLSWHGEAAPMVAMEVDLQPHEAVASVAVLHGGGLFLSHAGAITKSPYGGKLAGNLFAHRSAMPVPGTWTLLGAHNSTTLVAASSSGVVVWPDALGAGIRRVVLVRAWGPKGCTADATKYKRRADAPLHAIVARDALPAWPPSTAPVPAVMCGSDVLCQIDAAIYAVTVPLLDTVLSYDTEWTPRVVVSGVHGTLLAACPGDTPTVRIATTLGVYIDGAFTAMPACACATWVRPETLLRDGDTVRV